MSTTETEIVHESELARVVDWRLRALRRAGYGEDGAQGIAERVEIDLHRAIDLLQQRLPRGDGAPHPALGTPCGSASRGRCDACLPGLVLREWAA